MRRKYPKDSLYIGKVGAWLPWDPSEHLMPEVEYAEKDLNEIMRKYQENRSNAELFAVEEREAAIKKQKEENRARADVNRANTGGAAAPPDAVSALMAASVPIHPTEGVLRE
jgi:sRNA-binding protein